MKQYFFFLLATLCFYHTKAQLTVKTNCPELVVDVLDGKVNGIKPNMPFPEMKTKFSCYTKAAEADSLKCGGGIFYADKDLYIYTARDYVEVGPKFKGRLTVPLLGADKSKLFNTLGNPKLKDAGWEAYPTSYGILIVYFDKKNKINRLIISTRGTDNIQLCE